MGCKTHINTAIIVAVLSTCCLPTIFAQRENFGSWTSIAVDKKLNKFEIGAETEFRTIYAFRLLDRWSLGVNADYDLSKTFKLGAGYQLMNKLDKKYLNYQIRNRFNISGTGKLKFKDLSISLRERIQTTTKNESNRLRENGTIDTYKMNPEWSWRNRLTLSYNIPNFKITPSLSAESFYQLNNPDGNRFDNMRYQLAFDYKFDKRNQIEVFGVINSELDSEDASGKYILGVAYKYSLKQLSNKSK